MDLCVGKITSLMNQTRDSSVKILVGMGHSLRRVCNEMGYQRIPGRLLCEALY